MKLFVSLVLLTLCALASTASAAQGFSVISGTTLWTYADPSSLSMFEPKIVSLPLSAQSAVGGASSSSLDGFVVLGDTTVATYNVTQFSEVVNFGTSYLLGDVAFVPYSERVVAVGVSLGVIANDPAFFVSEDGGLTWGTPVVTSDITASRRPGSIAFGPGLGVAALGHLVYKSYDGKTWTSSYSNLAQTITKVAVLDSSTLVATGVTTGVISNAAFGIRSSDAGNTWTEITLPSFTPNAASVSGLVLVSAESWMISTSGGEIWSTQDGAKTWNRTFFSANISWTDLSYNSDWGVILAAGSYPLVANTPSVLALYYGSLPWTVSSPQSSASFSRIVPHVPSAAQSASPSPSHQPSPSASPSASTSTVPSHSPSPSHSAAPSHSADPSPTSSPSKGASHTPTPSGSPSHSRAPTHTPSGSPSLSPSPSKHTASPTPSPSPSKHTASPTPSASPSKHTASPSPSASPSKGSSRSPTPSPSAGSKKKDDSSSNKLALGLGLGLGLGGGLVLIGAIAGFYLYRRNAAQAHLYQPINTDV